MAALVELGSERWLKPGRYRWLRALAFLAVLAVACILAFNLAADATLRLAAMLAGEPFTTRAAAPSGARLSAVLVGSVGMLGTYALAVRLGEGRAAREIDPKRAPRELALGIAIGGAIMAIIIGVMWSAGWVVISAAPITGVAEAMKQAIQSAVIEETLMRIIIFRMLWRAFGVWPALLSTAILFGDSIWQTPTPACSGRSASSLARGSVPACIC